MGRSRLKSKTVPAPSGGINTIAPMSQLPAGDLIYSWNLIASEFGLRARNGYQEWVTGLTGDSDDLVRSVVPFTGGRRNGATNKLFVTTSSGIWDCSASTTTPTQVFEFAVKTGEAGYGTSAVISTPGGRYLLYCDEENGCIVYSEATSSWLALRAGATVAWTTTTEYQAGNLVVNGANAYICTVPGVSAGAGGPTGQGVAILDGSVTWNFYEGQWTALTAYAVGAVVRNSSGPERLYVCTVAGNAAAVGGPTTTGTGIVDGTCGWDYLVDYSPPVGMTLSDQQFGFTGTPDRFVHACVWKSRVWFTEKDTSRAYYMPINSIFGTASSWDFGVRMQTGGALVGLYNWSYDAGSGLDSLLVAISSSGDIVIYQGTDPATVATFGLKGTWSVGAVPYGRRLATDFGGELLVMSLMGLVQLSRLVVGQPVQDNVYVTDKVSNFFQLAASTNRLLQGWQVLLHPSEGALMLLLPTAPDSPCNPLVMANASKSWWPYRDLPIYSAQTWNGLTYFGTTDGRLCVMEGYVDGVTLADPDVYSPVQFSGLTGYSNLGNTRNKMVQLIRPTILAQSTNTIIQATPKYRFDTNEPAPPGAAAGVGLSNVWDTAVWDADIWGGSFSPLDKLSSGGGMGRDVAIAFRGSAVTRTVLVSMDVLYEEGGLL